MRKQSSIPGNKAFFNVHGANLTTLKLIGTMGQILSAASLSLAMYSILSDAIAGKGISNTTTLVVIGALFVAAFIELGNRLVAPPAIRPFVIDDDFEGSANAQDKHKRATRIYRAGLVLLGGISLCLSYVGSIEAGELITPEVVAVNTDSLTNTATTAIADVQAAFDADTAVLMAPYAVRKQAAKQQFEATKAEKTKAAQDFAGCADGGNKWCKKKQRAKLAEIDQAEAVYNATIATIATERGATLAAAIRDRKAALAEATGRSDEATDKAETAFAAAIGQAEKTASSTGAWFALITLVGQLMYYTCVYLQFVVTSGAEIEEELQPDEFYSQPSVWSDLRAVVNHRIERGLRRFIHYVFGERERLDKPLPYVSLYPDAAIDETDATSVMMAGGMAPELTETDAIATNAAPGFYRKGEDPHAHARNAMRSDANASITPPKTKTGNCPNCNSVFVMNTTWQKYCNTECRIDFNAKKNGGKRFDPQFRNKNKKKK